MSDFELVYGINACFRMVVCGGPVSGITGEPTPLVLLIHSQCFCSSTLEFCGIKY